MVQWVECSGQEIPAPAPAWRWQHWPVVPRCRGSEDVKVTDILLAAAAVSVRLMFYLVTTLVIDTLYVVLGDSDIGNLHLDSGTQPP